MCRRREKNRIQIRASCIRVVNLEKSLEFYSKALGLKEVEKNFPQHKFTVVYLSDENEEFEIKLTYDYEHGGKYNMETGFSHFALTVQDLKSSYTTHKKWGLKSPI